MKNLFLSFVFLGLILPILGLSQVVDTTFNPSILAEQTPRRIATMENGKILASGEFSLIEDHSARNLARLLSDGRPDTSFLFDKQIVESPTIFAAQADQKVIIAGHFTNLEGDFLGNLLRLNSDGSLDSSFIPLVDSSLTIIDFEILPNQKIFIAYSRMEDQGSSNQFTNVIELLDENGKPDIHFSAIEFTPNQDLELSPIAGVDFQSNNALIIVGRSLQLGTLIQSAFRFDSLGTLDPTFKPIIALEAASLYFHLEVAQNGNIAILSSTRLVFSFTVLDSLGNQVFTESRNQSMEYLVALENDEFLIAGDITTRIYREGKLTTISRFDSIRDVANHQGDILFVGSTADFKGIRRYIITGDQLVWDLNFKTMFKVLGTIILMDVAKNGKLIVSGGAMFINNHAVGPLAQLNPDGKLDTAFTTLGISRDPNYKPNNFDILPDGKIVLGSDGKEDGVNGTLNSLVLLNENGSFLNQFDVPSLSNNLTDVSDVVSDSKGRIYIVELRKDIQTGEQIFLQYAPIGSLQYEVKELTDSLTFAKRFFMLKNDQLMAYGSKITGFLHPALLRYNEDGTKDDSFDADLPPEFLISDVFTTKDIETFISGRERLPSGDVVFVMNKLLPNGQRDLSFSPSVEYKENFLPSMSVRGQLPNGLILVTGSFKEYNGVATPEGRILINRDGEFIQEFLPDVKGYINNLSIIDEESVYISGRFETPNGLKGLLKVIDIPQLTTSTGSIVKASQIELFPNPIFGKNMTLKLPEKYLFQTFDYSILETASGRVVQNGQLEVRTQNQIVLPSHLQGAYIIQLKNGATNLIQRFIIQN